jgi:nicotinamidase-related amidase
MLLQAARSQLLAIDMQERLMPAIDEADRVLRNGANLLQAAAEFSVPVAVTEQYPAGLGSTVQRIVEGLPKESPVFPKMSFSAMADEHVARYAEELRDAGRDQAVVFGVEAHVCVLQTALGLRERGFHVFVVEDAVSSRAMGSVRAACARLLHAGCHWVTTEMVLFEWLERAGTDRFRRVSALIK